MTERPLPIADTDSQPFWDACRSEILQAQRCSACQRFRWPPRGLCPHCHSWDFVWQRLLGEGTVVSFVVVHQATPMFADLAPYTIARISLDGTDDAVRMTSNIVAGEQVEVGTRVGVVFGPDGLPRFRPR